MGGIKVYIPDDVEHRFRRTAMAVYGYGKGALSKAAEEAFSQWSSEKEKALSLFEFVGDPVEAIEGLLEGVDKSGVELQHEARRIRARKVLR